MRRDRGAGQPPRPPRPPQPARLSAGGEPRREPDSNALDRTVAALWSTGDEFGLKVASGGTRIGFCDGDEEVGFTDGELRVQPDWVARLARHPLGRVGERLLPALDPDASGDVDHHAQRGVWLDLLTFPRV